MLDYNQLAEATHALKPAQTVLSAFSAVPVETAWTALLPLAARLSTSLYKENVLEPKSIKDFKFDIVDPKKLLERAMRHLDEKNACNTTKSTCSSALKTALLPPTVSTTSPTSQEAAAARATIHIACAAGAHTAVAASEGHKLVNPLAAAASPTDEVKATQALDSESGDSLEDDRWPKRVKSVAEDTPALHTEVPDKVSSGCLPCCSFNLGKADALQESKRSKAKRGRACRQGVPRRQ
ncbi:hypothetical protein COCOBI_12-5230 [Coccomyxa sp. Obi]|nr:hypothetical protein COCOBI_12-5230 [Coccomyxa sp. Obi]